MLQWNTRLITLLIFALLLSSLLGLRGFSWAR